MTDPHSHSASHLPVTGDGTMPVPVYDCHVLLSRPDEQGLIHARITSLPEITAAGQVEREVLQRIVKDFKAALVRYREQGQPIPWAQSPEQAQPGEIQRWIPVHL